MARRSSIAVEAAEIDHSRNTCDRMKVQHPRLHTGEAVSINFQQQSAELIASYFASYLASLGKLLDDDPRVAWPFLANQREQDRRIVRMQPHAAMRGGAAKSPQVLSALD